MCIFKYGWLSFTWKYGPMWTGMASIIMRYSIIYPAEMWAIVYVLFPLLIGCIYKESNVKMKLKLKCILDIDLTKTAISNRLKRKMIAGIKSRPSNKVWFFFCWTETLLQSMGKQILFFVSWFKNWLELKIIRLWWNRIGEGYDEWM